MKIQRSEAWAGLLRQVIFSCFFFGSQQQIKVINFQFYGKMICVLIQQNSIQALEIILQILLICPNKQRKMTQAGQPRFPNVIFLRHQIANVTFKICAMTKFQEKILAKTLINFSDYYMTFSVYKQQGNNLLKFLTASQW